ncbi:polygalacturonase [Pyrus x bretschneideri]|uniref:polygalacturonase n=1 Tax=Pyrus x bretschneideri TaxID=225117 RepID=UPI00202E3D2B|nr:polygalacturonase [Pyrus x bretschneideri]
MQLCLCQKVKVTMFSQNQFLSVLLIILASFPFSFSSDLGNPLVVLDLHRHHRTRRLQSTSAENVTVNVDHFGAKGDGGDDTQAFMNAWEKACSSKRGVELVVPKNRVYHLKPMNFSGPCQSDVTLKIYGTIKASTKRSDYTDLRHWILFTNLTNFRVEGGGTINGNGRKWWLNSCKVNESLPCTLAPNAVTFFGCNTLEVDNVRFRNAQRMHLSFQSCVNVKASNLIVTAPGDSPNTDGIHVTATQNIRISNVLIRTGDDCISIVSGSKNVRADDITCGPGHGISIGSLGAGNSQAEVSDVVVSKAKIIGTTNGLRIKTWQGGSGYATNIRFKNVMMANVSNPIIIDQYYCDQDSPCQEQASAVKISNVVYENVKGTSASKVAVKFDCSKSFGCQDILLKDVNLRSLANEIAQASCEHVDLSHRGTVSPKCSSLI